MTRKEFIEYIEYNGAIELGRDEETDYIYFLTINDKNKLTMIYIDPKYSTLESFDLSPSLFFKYKLEEIDV